VTVVNVVNIARQIQQCRGSGQMYSVIARHQGPDAAGARYLIASNSAWDRSETIWSLKIDRFDSC
jgi:hypothetical protein